MTVTRSVLWLVVVGCAPAPKDSGQPGCPDTPILTGSAGDDAICAIHEDGCLACDVWNPDSYPPTDRTWNDDGWWTDRGQHDVPDGSFSTVSVSNGATPQGTADNGLIDRGYPQLGICALTSAGAVVCWGFPYDEPDDYSGWVDAPTSPMRSVSQGYRHACGVDLNGHVACWGACLWGACETPHGVFEAVVASDDFSCALNATGDVQCRGWQEELGRSIACSPWTDETECAVANREAIESWSYGNGYVSLAATPLSVCGTAANGSVSCLAYYDGYLSELTGNGTSAQWWPVWGAHDWVEGVCGLDDSGLLTCSLPDVPEWYLAPIGHIEGRRFGLMFSGHGRLCGITESGELACAAYNDITLSCPFCTELYQGE